MSTKRSVFVISDLHVGGELGKTEQERGFRMCTNVEALANFVGTLPGKAPARAEIELVINGDFVDFLAEKHPTEENQKHFLPFIPDAIKAEAVFRRIVERDRPFFDALRTLVQSHRLTILLGNHDVELAYPDVTRALVDALGGPSERLRVQLDGQPYAVGDALIEHGNEYDGFNLIRERSIQALRSNRPEDFEIPPGSRLVAEIMNPIKETFPFVDLLKPEQESAIPLLIALDPSVRWKIGRVLALKLQADRRLRAAQSGEEAPPIEDETPDPVAEERLLRESLARSFGSSADAATFTELVRDASAEEEAVYSAGDKVALLSLVLQPRRLDALWRALQVLQTDLSFVQDREADPGLLRAVEQRAEHWAWVIMGHTHLAKWHKNVVPGCTYLNSGTWADIIPFPEKILSLGEARGRRALQDFMAAMRTGDLKPWIDFRPTYVRLDLEGQRVIDASLRSAREDNSQPT